MATRRARKPAAPPAPVDPRAPIKEYARDVLYDAFRAALAAPPRAVRTSTDQDYYENGTFGQSRTSYYFRVDYPDTVYATFAVTLDLVQLAESIVRDDSDLDPAPLGDWLVTLDWEALARRVVTDLLQGDGSIDTDPLWEAVEEKRGDSIDAARDGANVDLPEYPTIYTQWTFNRVARADKFTITVGPVLQISVRTAWAVEPYKWALSYTSPDPRDWRSA